MTTDRDTANHEHWLREAIELSRRCPPSATAFSVGAVVVDAEGTALSTGYSRETGPRTHAEEAALAKLGDRPRLGGATMYSSLEPCSVRKSSPLSCTRLIIDAGIPRVVFAYREPAVFVDCEGGEILAAAGVTVIELDALADEVRSVNAHLFD
jgi:pyrimidine deaminase RibD-like protein